MKIDVSIYYFIDFNIFRFSFTFYLLYAFSPNIVNDNLISKSGVNVESNNNYDLVLPWQNILRVLAMYLVFLGLGIGRATFEPCTSGYDGLIVVSFIPLLLLLVYSFRFADFDEIFDSSYISLSKDELQSLSIYIAPAVILVGIMCSLLGIGGGELLGPVMLSMNINPLISSATVPCFDLMSCIYNIISNYVSKAETLSGEFSGVVLLLGFGGSFFGRSLALYINKSFAHPSLLVMFFIVTLMVATSVYFYDFAKNDGITHKFTNLCE